MASTATNKQPLLVDRVLHQIVDLDGCSVPKGSGVALAGTNSATLLIDSVTEDGCIVEDIYSISRARAQGKEGYTIKLYMSTAPDYLRPQQGIFIGEFQADKVTAGVTHWEAMPFTLAPHPKTGESENKFRALFIPRGRALWAAVEQDDDNPTANDAPIIAAQGGWY